jgi:hypothetical protein
VRLSLLPAGTGLSANQLGSAGSSSLQITQVRRFFAAIFLQGKLALELENLEHSFPFLWAEGLFININFARISKGYFIKHCFNCRPSDPGMSEDVWIVPRAVNSHLLVSQTI